MTDRGPMRLAVIGDTQHYRDAEGRLCALEPVVAQLARWACLFDEVVLCAPLDAGPPPVGFAPYRATNLRIEPLVSAGGNTFTAKLGLLTHLAGWARRIRAVAREVDAVHLRCPCNIGLVAILATRGVVRYRYAMFAGVWRHYPGEPWSFGLQRRLLASPRFGGPVSVYASRDASRPHLEPSFSPSFSLQDWLAAEPHAVGKLRRIGDPDAREPWRLVTVGRLTENKNQATVVRAVSRLHRQGLSVHLDLFGDGPMRPTLEQLARELGVEDRVTFHGSVGHPRVLAAFADADLHLLSTRQEGYGKVLLEGMMFATVPIFGDSPVAAEIAGDGARGLVFDPDDDAALAAHVRSLVDDRGRWTQMADAARRHTRDLTLDAFEERVRDLLERHWDVSLARGER
ncbi:MAG: glycosyltransferase [Microthrixaceae bacterium]